MRVTHTMLQQSALNGMQANLRRLEETQRQATSQKRINRPEDDPAALEQALGYRARLVAGNALLENVAKASDWLGATERAFNGMTTLLTRADALALSGANDSMDATERNALATELNGILEEALATANTRHGGRYLFSGFKTDRAAYNSTRDPATNQITAVTYAGDTGLMAYEVEPGIKMTVNMPGSPTMNNMLNGLIQLRDTLQADPFVPDNVTTAMTTLRGVGDKILEAQAATGTQMRRLDAITERTESGQVHLQALLSKAEDADMAEVITRLSHQQFVYEASLQVNGQVLQRSLLDYLR